MSADPNKKSARTFQCRDVLWETFEQMARELECSVDYLVNEAMKQYARQRSYGTSRTPHPSSGRGVDASAAERSDRGSLTAPAAPPSPMPSSSKVAAGPPPGLPPPGRLPPPPTPSRQPSGALPAPRGGLPAPPPPNRPSVAAMPPLPRSAPPPPAPPATRSVPPPLPRGSAPGRPSMSPATNGHGHLTLVYNGERHSISKDRYVIGRGKQSSDLTLKDPNVSRQHAMIEFQNGVYFMVDMGSTNGVAINGQRIARKQIAEGDVFRICDHDLQFTYR